MENIQHSTSNIEHPANSQLEIHWLLDVGCSMFPIFFAVKSVARF